MQVILLPEVAASLTGAAWLFDSREAAFEQLLRLGMQSILPLESGGYLDLGVPRGKKLLPSKAAVRKDVAASPIRDITRRYAIGSSNESFEAVIDEASQQELDSLMELLRYTMTDLINCAIKAGDFIAQQLAWGYIVKVFDGKGKFVMTLSLTP